jgi:hypothetical protein
MSKNEHILETAKAKSLTVTRSADLWNYLFSPQAGIVANAYCTRSERATFVRTQEYRAIRQLVREARPKTGLVHGATPSG